MSSMAGLGAVPWLTVACGLGLGVGLVGLVLSWWGEHADRTTH